MQANQFFEKKIGSGCKLSKMTTTNFQDAGCLTNCKIVSCFKQSIQNSPTKYS